MNIRKELQRSPVADEVEAITAVVRPILRGLLYSLKQEVVNEAGGLAGMKLMMLPRSYLKGDGDTGICFEYAIHDAVNRSEPSVTERIYDAVTKHCKIPGSEVHSILFGAEKKGSVRLIDTAMELLTDDSQLLAGGRGRPVKLKRHISGVASAFRRPDARDALPDSIAGLWKADMFLGTESDNWVGTTIKINPRQLAPAKGLRVGLVPAREGTSDSIRRDESMNLIVCPLPYDHAFMEVFYLGWETVQQFINADAQLPKEVYLPRPPQREVARLLASRREFPVIEVIEALGPMAQPELLETAPHESEVVETREGPHQTEALIAPFATHD